MAPPAVAAAYRIPAAPPPLVDDDLSDILAREIPWVRGPPWVLARFNACRAAGGEGAVRPLREAHAAAPGGAEHAAPSRAVRRRHT